MKQPSAHPTGEVFLAGVLLLGLLVKIPGFSLFPASAFVAVLLLPVIAKDLRATRLQSALLAWTGVALCIGIALSLIVPGTAGTAGGVSVATPVFVWLASVPLVIAAGVWAFERIGLYRGTVLLFAGALVSSIVNSEAIGWKGSIGFYATLLALAVLTKATLFFTRFALVGAAALAAVFDARSMAIIVALTLGATFVSKRTLGWATHRPIRAVVMIASVGAGAAFLALQAMQSGLLGTAVQLRTLDQMRHGFLLTGARAEWAATIELFSTRPFGFGTGVRVEAGLQSDAVSAVRAAGGDAGATYFRTSVFGERTDLHSQLADMWFHFGLPGVVVAALLLLVLIASAPHLIGQVHVYGAAPIMASLIALWDICFSPMADIDRTLAGVLLAVVVTLASRRSMKAQDEAKDGLARSHALAPMRP